MLARHKGQRVKAHAIKQAGKALAQGGTKLVGRRLHRKGLQHLGAYQCRHLGPALLRGQLRELRANLAPAVALQHRPVGGGGGVEGDLLAHKAAHTLGGLRVGPSDHKGAAGNGAGGRIAPSPRRARRDLGAQLLTQIFCAVERVGVEAVAELAGQLGEARVDASNVDRDRWVLDRARVEEGRHQGVLVELATVVEARADLEGGPDGAQGLDIIAQAGHRLVEAGAEAALDVGAHLGAEAEHKAPVRVGGEIPGKLGGDHRAAGEGDGHCAAEGDLLGVLGGDGEGQEGIMAGLRRPEGGEAKGLGGAGKLASRRQGVCIYGDGAIEQHAVPPRRGS